MARCEPWKYWAALKELMRSVLQLQSGSFQVSIASVPV
jgi:hypothetical protein